MGTEATAEKGKKEAENRIKGCCFPGGHFQTWLPALSAKTIKCPVGADGAALNYRVRKALMTSKLYEFNLEMK